MKHFLYHLKKVYEIEDCFFALDRRLDQFSLFFFIDIEYSLVSIRILHSTFDIDITHCIQVILCSPRLSPVGHSDRLDMLRHFIDDG